MCVCLCVCVYVCVCVCVRERESERKSPCVFGLLVCHLFSPLFITITHDMHSLPSLSVCPSLLSLFSNFNVSIYISNHPPFHPSILIILSHSGTLTSHAGVLVLCGQMLAYMVDGHFHQSLFCVAFARLVWFSFSWMKEA